jgi:hypothetical protein
MTKSVPRVSHNNNKPKMAEEPNTTATDAADPDPAPKQVAIVYIRPRNDARYFYAVFLLMDILSLVFFYFSQYTSATYTTQVQEWRDDMCTTTNFEYSSHILFGKQIEYKDPSSTLTKVMWTEKSHMNSLEKYFISSAFFWFTFRHSYPAWHAYPCAVMRLWSAYTLFMAMRSLLVLHGWSVLFPEDDHYYFSGEDNYTLPFRESSTSGQAAHAMTIYTDAVLESTIITAWFGACLLSTVSYWMVTIHDSYRARVDLLH